MVRLNSIQTEICVVGAGPAGSLLAGLLATAGREVLLVGPGRTAAVTRLQSLAPAAHALLDDEGVDIAGAWARVPVHVDWPTSVPQVDEAVDVASTLVDRSGFDDALRAWAVFRGAVVVDGRIDRTPVAKADVTRLSIGSAQLDVDARSVVNAAGAHSVFAQSRHRVGQALFGISAETSAPVGGGGIWVVATSLGWVWAASIGDGRLSILTAHHRALPLSSAPEAVEAAVAAAQLDRRVGKRPALFAALRPVDLTASLADTATDFPTIGDAALTIDPLAGQGLAVALRSACQMADHILDGRPLVRGPSDVSAHHAQLAAHFYNRAAAHFDTPFWSDRPSFSRS